MKKLSQIDTEKVKNPKNFRISKLLFLFSKKLTDFVDWNVEKGQKRKKMLSSRFFRRVYCSFSLVKVSQTENENDKIQKFPTFKNFMRFLLKVRQTL